METPCFDSFYSLVVSYHKAHSLVMPCSFYDTSQLVNKNRTRTLSMRSSSMFSLAEEEEGRVSDDNDDKAAMEYPKNSSDHVRPHSVAGAL